VVPAQKCLGSREQRTGYASFYLSEEEVLAWSSELQLRVGDGLKEGRAILTLDGLSPEELQEL
jgi:hypothetical protein